jgi:hypothetical protein
MLGYFTSAEMAYLGLSRTKPANRSRDPVEEDDLALRMLWPRISTRAIKNGLSMVFLTIFTSHPL